MQNSLHTVFKAFLREVDWSKLKLCNSSVITCEDTVTKKGHVLVIEEALKRLRRHSLAVSIYKINHSANIIVGERSYNPF